jgi:hypothetical protein
LEKTARRTPMTDNAATQAKELGDQAEGNVNSDGT